MMHWLAQAPALGVALLVVFGPGLLMGLGLKLRGLALWAAAPLLSTATIAALAIIFGVIGVPWSLLTVAAGCAGTIVVAWAVGLALGRRRLDTPERRATGLLLAGLAVGILLGAVRFALYLGDPDNVSQTNDAMFHLNALRWIIDTGNASSFHVSGVIGARGMYPGAWHGLTSVVALGSGIDLPVAANAMSFVIGFVVWPISLAWMTCLATGSRTTAAIAAALSTSLLAFPMLMLEWGVLYSYALAVALLPAAVATVIATVRWAGGEGPVTGPVRGASVGAILVVAAAGALALAQPALILAWGLLAMLWLTGAAAGARRRRAIALLAALVGWAALLTLWYVLSRHTSGAHWPPFRSRPEALLDVVANGPMWLPPAIGVSVLCVVGLVVAVRKGPLRWLVAAWLLLSGLYVAAASIGAPIVREAVIGAWYADPYRFAALAPIAVVPLAAIGLHAVASWAASAISRRREQAHDGTPWALAGVAAVGIAELVAAPVIPMPNVFENRWDTQPRYASNADSFLSPDERAVLERLPETVPEDAVIIANPSTGAAFGYALSGRDVYPRTWQPPGGNWGAIAYALRYVATDPAVCPALAEFESPSYVLDFGEGEASPGRYVMEGMTGLDGQPGFELVDEEGDASLWRITACAPVGG